MRALAEVITVIAGVLGIVSYALRAMRPRIERWLGIQPRVTPSEHLRHMRELDKENEEIDEILGRIRQNDNASHKEDLK